MSKEVCDEKGNLTFHEADARAELIRLQKETHLLEHGFYDFEIRQWFEMEIMSDAERWESIRTKTENVMVATNEDIKREWFKRRFPEFFEKEVD